MRDERYLYVEVVFAGMKLTDTDTGADRSCTVELLEAGTMHTISVGDDRTISASTMPKLTLTRSLT